MFRKLRILRPLGKTEILEIIVIKCDILKKCKKRYTMGINNNNNKKYNSN